jgi:hypothetical protein
MAMRQPMIGAMDDAGMKALMEQMAALRHR